jgi:hypothetical protein
MQNAKSSKTKLDARHKAGTILLLLLLFAQALGAARAASVTFDEGPHLAAGYSALRTGDLRLQPIHIHPPLANALAAAPLLLDPSLPDPRAVSGWEIASLSALSDAIVWQNPRPARLALVTRLPIILLAVLAGALVYRWAADLGGNKAGLLALGLYALDPNVVAHGSLVTTDMAVTALGLLTFFLLHRCLRRPNRARLTGVGLALGLALASKVSAVLLVPLVGAVLVLRSRREFSQGLRAWLAVVLVALAVLWAAYGFELRPLPQLSASLSLPATTHIEIYRSLQEHYRLGHPAFFMGQNSDQGWWAYFPLALAIKTPLPTLILLALALVTALYRRSPPGLSLALFPLVHLCTALFSSVNIGYRHLLPALPFLYIFTAHQLRVMPFGHCVLRVACRVPRVTHHVLRFTCYVLCFTFFAWLVVGMARVYPYPLAYFNELAGGSDGGYRWLVDSNLDWGQNLWGLRDWMRDAGVERVYYSHFSPARPQVYGVEVDWLPPDPRAVPFAPLDPAPGIYAIGATVLQGAYTPDVNTFAWFRGQAPLARLGHALFLYEVPPREPLAWAALCANPGPVLSPETVRARLARPDLRVISLDCGQSWLYPATDEARALYVWPPDAAPPPGTALEMTARHPDGRPFYTLYHLQGAGPRPVLPLAIIDGPLIYWGYQQKPQVVHAGETAELLWTWWQVREVPNRPLSLMAHLVGPDGVPIAVADGLGVPIEQWQPGDVIVQRHHFTLPEDAPPGAYSLYVGAYWLDTLERWTVRSKQGSSDQIEVGMVDVQ